MWNTEHKNKPESTKPEVPDELKERPVAEGDLLGNFVRRTDNDFRGVKEQSLIGEDIGDDEDEEAEEEQR
ncbi:hypothetical protein [Aureimonas leprariae]|uniref:Uncharacterized protein n=1 Tax=Plantimonas leprariae TaxID=2615207 RepID=A0A7V7TVZ6_9HYPH|nr:hypothetical protein [Aureimonas leprariae]KAB0679339.1 hypothetical protein F6X38_13465 [Aureimonas leprariae]